MPSLVSTLQSSGRAHSPCVPSMCHCVALPIYEFLYITRHTPILHFQFSIACLHIHLSVNPFDSIKGWDTNTLPLVFHGEESPILKEKQKTKSPSISEQPLTNSIVTTDSRLRVGSRSDYLFSTSYWEDGHIGPYIE